MYLLPLIFSLLSMFSVATFWTPRAAASGSQEKQNDTSIVKRADAYRKAVIAADVPALAAMFDDDAILMPPNQPFLRGRLPIRRFYEDWCHSPMSLHFRSSRCYCFGRLRIRRGDLQDEYPRGTWPKRR